MRVTKDIFRGELLRLDDMDSLPEYRYILQIHRDDRFWYERPCKNDDEVIETCNRVLDQHLGDRIWFRIYAHYTDSVKF